MSVRNILNWLVTLFIPIALFSFGERILITRVFLEIEYRLPEFPQDLNGLPEKDRLHYAEIILDYLINNADISFLSKQNFPSGVSLFNNRELRHIKDVKRLIQPALWLGYGIWFFILGVGLWAHFNKWQLEFQRSLCRGGWLTVGLAAAIIIFAIVNFRQFSIFYHSLFFAENSWRFPSNNTLIRLFPRRFWRDAFLVLSTIAIGGGLVLGLGLRKKIYKV